DDDGERNATVSVTNSTLSNNRAGGRGGGVYVRDGSVTIAHSTISGNSGTGGEESSAGGGLYGYSIYDPEAEEPVADSQVDVSVTHTIIYGNLDSYSMSNDDVSGTPAPYVTITSANYNIVGVDNYGAFTQPNDMVGVDPLLLPLSDYGGETQVFLPSNDPDGRGVSPAIDAGDPMISGDLEQRGQFFVRTFDGDDNGTAIVDIGASEVQSATFLVNELFDQFDNGQYVDVLNFGNQFATYDVGQFVIREAIDFSAKNPEVDVISFDALLQSRPDVTPSLAPTVFLTLGDLTLDHSAVVRGPSAFEIEIDAAGNDPDPGIPSGRGSHVFFIDDGDNDAQSHVAIEKVTLVGADALENGGAIFSFEDLSIANATIQNNSATQDGGGVYIELGDLLVQGSTFANNFAARHGGGIFVAEGGEEPVTAIIANSTVSGNTAGNRGGGVANLDGEVFFQSSTVTLNESGSTRGGGVATFSYENASTTFLSTIVSGNLSFDVEFVGGTNNVVSSGYNLIGSGNAVVSFVSPGDQVNVLDPMLAPLTNAGGPTPTHRPLGRPDRRPRRPRPGDGPG
ncbi:MAG: choice-of-anchor Q domain-containing protein, partial [Planctomycetota bacterium]